MTEQRISELHYTASHLLKNADTDHIGRQLGELLDALEAAQAELVEWKNAHDNQKSRYEFRLAELQSELERVKEQVRWRPVTEEPAGCGEYLVVWMVDGVKRNEVERWNGDRWLNYHSDNRSLILWMPLPAPDAKEGK